MTIIELSKWFKELEPFELKRAEEFTVEQIQFLLDKNYELRRDSNSKSWVCSKDLSDETFKVNTNEI